MSSIFKTFAILVYVITFTQMAPKEGVAAEQAVEDYATKDAAAVKACLDFVDAKSEEQNAVQQKEAEDEVPGTPAPDAAKEGPKLDPEAYLESVAKSKPKFAAENCIGIVADACLATDDGGGTLGMMECYGRESEVWDARLNASYRKQTATSSKKQEDEVVVKHLRKVQTAWIPWRDATCEVLYANGIPLYGSDSKIESIYCDMVLTARQALSVEGKMIMSFDMPSGQ